MWASGLGWSQTDGVADRILRLAPITQMRQVYILWFYWLLGVSVHAILIWLLCPALASNAITQEKEQQTWEMLLFTLLTPAEILLGKLAARIAPMIAVVLAFWPFMMICYAEPP